MLTKGERKNWKDRRNERIKRVQHLLEEDKRWQREGEKNLKKLQTIEDKSKL